MSSLLPVAEIFGPTLQGEGIIAGRREMFVRFGYCDGPGAKMRAKRSPWCDWCDSLHAVDPTYKTEWRMLSERQIGDELRALSDCRNVTLTGGNPLIHNLEDLIGYGSPLAGYSVNVETQGTIYRPWLKYADTITVSPKPPSSGNEPRLALKNFERFLDRLLNDISDPVGDYFPGVCIKIAVDPRFTPDAVFAQNVFAFVDKKQEFTYAPLHKMLSVVRPTHVSNNVDMRLRDWRLLAEKVMCGDFGDIRMLPQLHTLLWPERTTGV